MLIASERADRRSQGGSFSPRQCPYLRPPSRPGPVRPREDPYAPLLGDGVWPRGAGATAVTHFRRPRGGSMAAEVAMAAEVPASAAAVKAAPLLALEPRLQRQFQQKVQRARTKRTAQVGGAARRGGGGLASPGLG